MPSLRKNARYKKNGANFHFRINWFDSISAWIFSSLIIWLYRTGRLSFLTNTKTFKFSLNWTIVIFLCLRLSRIFRKYAVSSCYCKGFWWASPYSQCSCGYKLINFRYVKQNTNLSVTSDLYKWWRSGRQENLQLTSEPDGTFNCVLGIWTFSLYFLFSEKATQRTEQLTTRKFY